MKTFRTLFVMPGCLKTWAPGLDKSRCWEGDRAPCLSKTTPRHDGGGAISRPGSAEGEVLGLSSCNCPSSGASKCQHTQLVQGLGGFSSGQVRTQDSRLSPPVSVVEERRQPLPIRRGSEFPRMDVGCSVMQLWLHPPPTGII